MTAELGGFTGIVEPDEETVRFVKERRGVDIAIEPWMKSDPGAIYADILRIDCAALSPIVARPGDPGNGVPLSELADRVAVDIAYGGSCTAGKREDFDQYHAVLAWAAERGPARRRRHDALPSVRHRGRARLLHATRLPRGVRGGRRRHAATRVRRLRELRARRVDAHGPGDGQRDQPQLPRPIGSRPGVAREPADGRGERHRRATCVVRRAAAELTSAHKSAFVRRIRASTISPCKIAKS